MAFTFGFYNALNHDRRYNAIQVSSIFDGIIKDGIFMSIGGHMNVKATGNGFNIVVESGRAWFNHTWSLLDADYPMAVSPSDVLEDRIDVVVLEVNENVDVRQNFIKIIAGTPAEHPTKPALTNNLDIHQYALAYITVPANSVTLTQSNVENAVGLGSTPFVTGILETINIDDLVAQWKSQWSDWTEEVDLNWNNWFDTVDNAWTTWFTQQQSKWEDILTERTEEWEEIKDTVDSEWASQQGSINSDYTNWKSSALAAYNQWLDQIKGTLDDDAATQLAKEVVELKNRDDVISTYQHVKSGTEHMFIGSGSNGKVKMTADIASGDKVVISSAPKEKVTVDGATSQPGSGDPSPDNIRMIDGIGMYDQRVVFDGSEDEDWQLGITGTEGKYRLQIIATPKVTKVPATSVAPIKSNHFRTISATGTWNNQTGIAAQTNNIYIYSKEYQTVQSWKSYLAENPLIVWYRSVDFYKSKGPFYYVHEVSDGTESPYKAIGIELNTPLFDGDSLEIGGPSGFDQMVVLDSGKFFSQVTSGGLGLGYYQNSLNFVNIDTRWSSSGYGHIGSDYLPSIGFSSVYNGSIGIGINPNGYVQLRLPGNANPADYFATHPLTVFYRSVDYTPEADIAVALEKRVNGYAVWDGTDDMGDVLNLGEVTRGNIKARLPAKHGSAGWVENSSCSHLRKLYNWESNTEHFYINHYFYLFVANSRLDSTDLAGLKAWLATQYSAGTPVQVVYELASAATYAHPIQTESLPAYYGTEDFVTALTGEKVAGKWLTFTNDGTQLNFKGGGGLSSSKLAAANAEPGDVRTGKKFYAGDKTIKTGTLPVLRTGESHQINRWQDPMTKEVFIQANTIPEGIYESNGSTLSPQINIPAELFGNAAASQVLAGVTFTSENGAKIAGTMPNQGAKTAALNAGGSYTIPKGWHNGKGKVTADSLGSQTPASAKNGDVILGKTAWVNGVMVTGTMPERGAWNETIDPGASVRIPQGYHNGNGVVRANGISINFHPIDRTVGWGSGIRFTGEDTTPGVYGKMHFVLKYWCRTEYNVNGYIKVLRNGSEIHSTTFNKNYDSPYNDDVPNGYINVEFSGSGTYQIQVSVDYNAGNGEIKMGGAFIGY